MKTGKKAKLALSLVLTAAVLLGTVLSGCADNTSYTEEIKEYQSKLESLAAENEELKAQLGLTEESTEAEATETEAESQSETATETAAETQTETETQTQTQAESQSEDGEKENEMQILVLGDSIWDNYRDGTGVASKTIEYLGRRGYNATIYNAAVGGTRATLKPEDNQYQFNASSDCSLAMMLSVLAGRTDVELLQGRAAYENVKQAMAHKDEVDYVILAYGMNDFLAEAEINDSDNPWTGYGTALTNGVYGVREVFPAAQILIVAPSYASYFSVPVQNMGEKALYNYASIATDVARGQETLCVDAYNNLGIDAYNADEYIEDGVHLNAAGRALYARHVASCLLAGVPGQVSGNAIDFDK